MTPVEQFRQAVRERLEKATRGHLVGHHSKPIAEVKEQVIASVAESIEKSIAHDGGHAWHWIEAEGGVIVCQTGCGPTSEANLNLFGNAPTDLTKYDCMLEVALRALERIVVHDKRLPDFTDNPQTIIASEALAEINRIAEESGE